MGHLGNSRPSKQVNKECKNNRNHTDTCSDISANAESVPKPVDAAYTSKLGHPGEYPYTRGINSSMYKGRLWTMRQYAGYESQKESNKRYRYLLSQGQNGLSVAFDLPTQIGYDSDHPYSKGEVGKVGVPICSLVDMESLFREIPLEQVTTSMTINSTASILLSLYIAVAKIQGVTPNNLRGTLQNDILKEYIARGTYIYPPESSMRLVTDIIQYCSTNLPLWNTISISGYHLREAGATASQELGFTLANGIEYVQSAINTGLNVDSFAGRISFFFSSHNNFLEEVAKFRAGRRLWANIMRDKFKAKNPRSLMMRFHTQTAGVTLTAQQPDNNVVRTTVQALAAVLGGTQSLHVNSKDEALALPSEQAAQLSLRTQQIIANESGVIDVADPLGGSYFLESLTDEIENQARNYIQIISDRGGAVSSIKQGYQMQVIQESAYAHQKQVENNEKIIVGINEYAEPDTKPTTLQIDPSAEEKQVEQLRDIKQKRDLSKVKRSLMLLRDVATTDDNTMPATLECVENYCTIGEISNILRGVFGEHQQLRTL